MEYNPSVKDFIFIFFKRKRLILSITLLVVSIVMVDNIIRYPTYEASSKVLIKPGTADIVITPGDTEQIVSPKITIEDVNSEIAIIKSRPLMERVVTSLQLDKMDPTGYRLVEQRIKAYLPFTDSGSEQTRFEETVTGLQDDVWVEVVEKSNIIQINYPSSNPEVTAGVINTLTDYFLEQHLKVYQTPKAYDFFQSEAGEYKVRLEAAENALKEFQENEDIVSLEEQKKLNLKNLFEFEKLLKETGIEIAGLRTKIKDLRTQLSEEPERVSEAKRIEDNPIVGGLRVKLLDLNLELNNLLLKFNEDNRKIKEKREEIEIVREMIEVEEKKFVGSETTGLNPIYWSLKEELLEGERLLNELLSKREAFGNEVDFFKKRSRKLNRKELKLWKLERDVEINKDKFLLYSEKGEEARISKELAREKIVNVSIVSHAFTPVEPIGPNIILNIPLAFILGLFGSSIFALILERLDHSFKTPADIERILGLPHLASIPDEDYSFS